MAHVPDRDAQDSWRTRPCSRSGFRPLGVAAAIGLVLFFVCAIYTHIRASDYSPQFYLANGFLALNVAVLAVALQANSLSAIAIPLS